MFDEQKKLLLNSLDDAHSKYHEVVIFSGPSVYFHLKSLEASNKQDFDRFAEHVYAMLASWGMHRMGPGGSKMCDFEEFRCSLRGVWKQAMDLRRRTPSNLSECDWSTLETIFHGISCMKSGTTLVGNSKVMAHLLPNLIPPVDRAYTLTFLFKHGRIKNGKDSEWKQLKKILEEFFYPFVLEKSFQRKAKQWLAQSRWSKWDTSELKIVDNLVIGLSKMKKADRR